MRRFLASVVMLGLAACSAREKSAEEADIASGPAVSVTAAPGVAFNYRYAFRLPNARIAAVQEQHAQACERLGVNRCRITGLRYRLVDEDHVAAMLAFKLDPAIARQFGKDAIATVQKAEGMLVDSEIGGTDVGGAIKRAQNDAARIRDDLTRLETELKRGDLKSADRARIETEATELRHQLRETENARADNEESLATTPVAFEYGAGGLIPGFEGSPIKQAFATATASFVTMLSVIIVAVGTLIPWVLVLVLLLLAARTRPVQRLRAFLFPARAELAE